MITYNVFTFIGTSHISIQSIKEVKNQINQHSPDIIALELDQRRFLSLISKKTAKPSLKDSLSLGFIPFLINTIGGYIQRKLGDLVGIKPGSEMLKAISLAKQNNIKIALIDQDIKLTLKNLSKNFTTKEKLRFFIDLIKSPFSTQKISLDLRRVPDDKLIKMVINKVRQRYPSIYKSLIDDRNKVMAKNLYNIKKENLNSKIVVVVGAGHLPELVDYLKEYEKNHL